MESVMFKKIFTFALLTGSLTGFAQTMEDRMDRARGRLEGTFPEVRASETEDDKRLHMGLTAGINDPENTEASPEFGINVGFQPVVPFGVGADVSTTQLDDGTDDQRTTVLAKGTYNFGGDVPVLRSTWIGVGAGPVIIDDKFEWAAAPIAGFDIPLSSKMHDVLSLGVDAKYLFISDREDGLVASAAVKYWY